MTIIALLRHSLANLRLKSIQFQQQKALRSRERSYGFWTTLVAARLQEAELIASRYIPRLDNAAAGEPIPHFKGWTQHR
ncbi:hypothetical protein HPT29_022675 [Microvirga terrae]|uniref:DUF1127 domain-containing protein n=1 Tax=Microvirga terrae TaxID=2740529 RepID=A0ABY5RPP6_9HYPH|nr:MULTISPECIES: hypothetical protein [Microvirga]MBQ0822220.1 hypothetical protein [Microvirga sp. HBU67558]UVF19211.1 hypothetical protein HPT29_022675 [Microvirga terrae]